MAALITRCPVCATMFKVVPDQLRISEGWVRCGHCGEVFDAGANLQDAAAVAAAQSALQAAASGETESLAAAAAHDGAGRAFASNDSELPSEPSSELPSHALSSEPPASGLPADSVGDFASDGSSISSRLSDDLPQLEPDPAELADAARALREDPRDRPFELRRQDLSQPAELASVPPPVERAPAAASHDEPTFVRQARRQARWQHPAARALLLLVSIALLAVLGLQVALQERDRLAASEPALRPWLDRLCAEAGCRIAPPRQIDAIAIDSSSFNKLRPDAFRLQVTLKNQGRTAVAMPWLELTLTDSDEQPVVRRVLAPAELGATRAALAPATEWSSTVALGVADNSLASRISGYRLLAFYP
jgi:predicted Zn finger-like uncharacterized protein